MRLRPKARYKATSNPASRLYVIDLNLADLADRRTDYKPKRRLLEERLCLLQQIS